MSPWTEKYRPNCFVEVKGQDLAIECLKIFIKKFPLGKKAIIIHGPPGTGKTTLAHVSSKETNSEIFELNASDFRDKERLEQVLKPALEQKPLSKKQKIILIDEVDGISATDWGALTELLSFIEKTSYPIILTANDIWDRKFSMLRKKCQLVQLKEVDYRTIKEILNCILKKENLSVNNETLTSISVKAKGDIRAAINDLQAVAHAKDLSPKFIDERNKEIDIFYVLRKIFKNKAGDEMLDLYDSVKTPLDEIFLWIEENIPAEYQGEELANAYERLSKADIFRGRIYKQQYWRFLVYENILLSFGIAAAKKNPKTGFTTYKKPERVLKIWLHNQKEARKKSIAIKYAHYAHVGIKRALNEFRIIKPIIKSNQAIQKELKLDEEEINYIMNGDGNKNPVLIDV